MKRKATDHDGTDNVNRRLHNVLFNTHTVSGIVISVALYVIFLAGAFALFQNNINNCEINEPAKEFALDLDDERVLAEGEKKGYQRYSRDCVVVWLKITGNIYAFLLILLLIPLRQILLPNCLKQIARSTPRQRLA